MAWRAKSQLSMLGRMAWSLIMAVAGVGAVAGHDTAGSVREGSVVKGGVLAAAMIMATWAATGAAGVIVLAFSAQAVVMLVPGKDGVWW